MASEELQALKEEINKLDKLLNELGMDDRTSKKLSDVFSDAKDELVQGGHTKHLVLEVKRLATKTYMELQKWNPEALKRHADPRQPPRQTSGMLGTFSRLFPAGTQSRLADAEELDNSLQEIIQQVKDLCGIADREDLRKWVSIRRDMKDAVHALCMPHTPSLMHAISASSVWLSVKSQLECYNTNFRNTDVVVAFRQGAGMQITAMACDGEGRVWTGHAGGAITVHERATWSSSNSRINIMDREVLAIAFDTSNRAWVGDARGNVRLVQYTVSAGVQKLEIQQSFVAGQVDVEPRRSLSQQLFTVAVPMTPVHCLMAHEKAVVVSTGGKTPALSVWRLQTMMQFSEGRALRDLGEARCMTAVPGLSRRATTGGSTSPDRAFLTGHRHGQMVLWLLEPSKLCMMRTFGEPVAKNIVRGIAIYADLGMLVAGYKDGSVRVSATPWTSKHGLGIDLTESGDTIVRLNQFSVQAHKKELKRFAADSSTLVTASVQGMVRVWNAMYLRHEAARHALLPMLLADQMFARESRPLTLSATPPGTSRSPSTQLSQLSALSVTLPVAAAPPAAPITEEGAEFTFAASPTSETGLAAARAQLAGKDSGAADAAQAGEVIASDPSAPRPPTPPRVEKNGVAELLGAPSDMSHTSQTSEEWIAHLGMNSPGAMAGRLPHVLDSPEEGWLLVEEQLPDIRDVPFSTMTAYPSTTLGADDRRLSLADNQDERWNIPITELVEHEVVGEGAYGSVVRGHYLRKEVAIKTLKLEGIDSDEGRNVLHDLQREVKVLSSVAAHPNVVRLIGVCLEPPRIVMEFYQRGSVFKLLQKAREGDKNAVKQLSWHRRLAMLCDVACGMIFLHSKGVIHGDLRSPNVFIAKDGSAVIGDFGLAKVLMKHGEVAASRSVDAEGTNPRWTAPEVLQTHSMSRESDVFSFGIIMWELLTWRQPFEDMSTPAVLWNGCNNPKEHFPELPSDDTELPGQDKMQGRLMVRQYKELMNACWAGEPSERPSFMDIQQKLVVIKHWVTLLSWKCGMTVRTPKVRTPRDPRFYVELLVGAHSQTLKSPPSDTHSPTPGTSSSAPEPLPPPPPDSCPPPLAASQSAPGPDGSETAAAAGDVAAEAGTPAAPPAGYQAVPAPAPNAPAGAMLSPFSTAMMFPLEDAEHSDTPPAAQASQNSDITISDSVPSAVSVDLLSVYGNYGKQGDLAQDGEAQQPGAARLHASHSYQQLSGPGLQASMSVQPAAPALQMSQSFVAPGPAAAAAAMSMSGQRGGATGGRHPQLRMSMSLDTAMRKQLQQQQHAATSWRSASSRLAMLPEAVQRKLERLLEKQAGPSGEMPDTVMLSMADIQEEHEEEEEEESLEGEEGASWGHEVSRSDGEEEEGESSYFCSEDEAGEQQHAELVESWSMGRDAARTAEAAAAAAAASGPPLPPFPEETSSGEMPERGPNKYQDVGSTTLSVWAPTPDSPKTLRSPRSPKSPRRSLSGPRPSLKSDSTGAGAAGGEAGVSTPAAGAALNAQGAAPADGTRTLGPAGARAHHKPSVRFAEDAAPIEATPSAPMAAPATTAATPAAVTTAEQAPSSTAATSSTPPGSGLHPHENVSQKRGSTGDGTPAGTPPAGLVAADRPHGLPAGMPAGRGALATAAAEVAAAAVAATSAAVAASAPATRALPFASASPFALPVEDAPRASPGPRASVEVPALAGPNPYLHLAWMDLDAPAAAPPPSSTPSPLADDPHLTSAARPTEGPAPGGDSFDFAAGAGLLNPSAQAHPGQEGPPPPALWATGEAMPASAAATATTTRALPTPNSPPAAASTRALPTFNSPPAAANTRALPKGAINGPRDAPASPVAAGTRALPKIAAVAAAAVQPGTTARALPPPPREIGMVPVQTLAEMATPNVPSPFLLADVTISNPPNQPFASQWRPTNPTQASVEVPKLTGPGPYSRMVGMDLDVGSNPSSVSILPLAGPNPYANYGGVAAKPASSPSLSGPNPYADHGQPASAADSSNLSSVTIPSLQGPNPWAQLGKPAAAPADPSPASHISSVSMPSLPGPNPYLQAAGRDWAGQTAAAAGLAEQESKQSVVVPPLAGPNPYLGMTWFDEDAPASPPAPARTSVDLPAPAGQPASSSVEVPSLAGPNPYLNSTWMMDLDAPAAAPASATTSSNQSVEVPSLAGPNPYLTAALNLDAPPPATGASADGPRSSGSSSFDFATHAPFLRPDLQAPSDHTSEEPPQPLWAQNSWTDGPPATPSLTSKDSLVSSRAGQQQNPVPLDTSGALYAVQAPGGVALPPPSPFARTAAEIYMDVGGGGMRRTSSSEQQPAHVPASFAGQSSGGLGVAAGAVGHGSGAYGSGQVMGSGSHPGGPMYGLGPPPQQPQYAAAGPSGQTVHSGSNLLYSQGGTNQQYQPAMLSAATVGQLHGGPINPHMGMAPGSGHGQYPQGHPGQYVGQAAAVGQYDQGLYANQLMAGQGQLQYNNPGAPGSGSWQVGYGQGMQGPNSGPQNLLIDPRRAGSGIPSGSYEHLQSGPVGGGPYSFPGSSGMGQSPAHAPPAYSQPGMYGAAAASPAFATAANHPGNMSFGLGMGVSNHPGSATLPSNHPGSNSFGMVISNHPGSNSFGPGPSMHGAAPAYVPPQRVPQSPNAAGGYVRPSATGPPVETWPPPAGNSLDNRPGSGQFTEAPLGPPGYSYPAGAAAAAPAEALHPYQPVGMQPQQQQGRPPAAAAGPPRARRPAPGQQVTADGRFKPIGFKPGTGLDQPQHIVQQTQLQHAVPQAVRPGVPQQPPGPFNNPPYRR